MDDLETQITDEVAAITGFLEQQLGRRSRWNGEVELSGDPTAFGKALWNGRISINRQTAQTDLRWRTEIHEALHLLSAGLTPTSYIDFEGWEEGVVEQLQRLLRPAVLNALAVVVPNSVFVAVEAHHDYNRFIQALERIRAEVSTPPFAFYRDLLGTPLAARPSSVIQLGRQLPAREFRRFQKQFAGAFTVLRGD